MDKKLLKVLVDPKTKSKLKLNVTKEKNGKIIEGELISEENIKFPIIKEIPRFVSKENYAEESFGFQWNKHSKILLDSHSNNNVVKKAIFERTQWTEGYLKNKKVLECGSGAGIDSEILLELGAELYTFDLSSAVEANFKNNSTKKKFNIFQADIFKIPVKDNFFDVVYCHRVIQHTPNPRKAFVSMARKVAPGGELFMHSYDKTFKNNTQWRYLYRPLTTRMDEQTLYKILTKVGPTLFNITYYLDKFFLTRGFHHFFIPFYNHSKKYGNKYSKEDIYEFSLLNTFDSLSPKYDIPTNKETMIKWFKKEGFEKIKVIRRNPLIVKGFKKK